MVADLDALSKRATSLQATVDDLLKRLDKLRTFSDAAQWDADTQVLIGLLDQFKSELQTFQSQKEADLQSIKLQRSSLPIHKRIFASKDQEKIYEKELTTTKDGILSVEKAIEKLYEMMDRTPSSKQEQKEMLSEYRQIKKELTVEKRSANEEMRKIRVQARQQMTNWTGVSGKGFVGSVARSSRSSIRSLKEAALRPNEDAKAAIERQLIEVEKKINYVSKFTGDDPEKEQNVIRCAYCGRRVRPNEVCSGCGSDRTILDS